MTGDPEATVVDQSLTVDGRTFTVTALSMGNPHCVIFVDDPYAEDLATLGPAIEHHPAFPPRPTVPRGVSCGGAAPACAGRGPTRRGCCVGRRR